MNLFELAKAEGIDLKKYEAYRKTLTPEQRRERRIKNADIKSYFYTVSLVAGVTMVLSYSVNWSVYAFIALALINFPAVYLHSKRERNLYKLSDIGYFVHLLLAILLLVWEFKEIREGYFQALFVLATGPMLLKVYNKGYSPIFHSITRFFELYYYIVPALLFFFLRWFNDSPKAMFTKSEFEVSTVIRSIGYAFVIMIVWALLHFVLIKTICAKRKSRSSPAPDDILATKDAKSNVLLENFMYFGIASIPAVLAYSNVYLNVVLLLGVGIISIYRAGDYYVYDFPTSYQKNLKEMAASGRQ